MTRLILLVALALTANLQLSVSAVAQDWPQRAVKFILPFGPGSGVDTTARLLGDRLSARWGKPVVVENRAGGDGLVSINAFLSADDDHTLLDKVPYDSERDLLPIVNVTVIVLAISAPASLNVNSLADFVALARAKPNTLNVAAAAGNSDLIMSGFIKSQNLPMTKVPYRDIMQAPTDLAEGRIQLLLASYAAMRPLIQAGKLKLLAVTSRERVGIAPNIPTVAEAGFPYLGIESLIGLFGRRGTSDALRQKIAADVKATVTADPTIATRLAATGQIVDIRGPAEFAAGIQRMREQLASIAKTLGIKAAR
jgi:tripartite-type tricarboxylate transporter receptor subunit TctC